MDSKQIKKLEYLFYRYSDGTITREEMGVLNALMLESDSVRQKYYQFLKTELALKHCMEGYFQIDTHSESLSQSMREMAEYEKIAPKIEIPKEKIKQESIQRTASTNVVYTFNKSSLLTAILGIAALILIVFFVKVVPEPQNSVEVATLADQLNVRWGNPELKLGNGSRLSTQSTLLNLEEGIINIHYDTGVDLVIEGPALFGIERSGIFLEYGLLYSHVSEFGIGFQIQTPTSQFIDHGTEFGVKSNIDGSSELHVMKGKVQLFASSKGKSKFAQLVTENEAMRFNANTSQLETIPIANAVFAREIDSKTGFVWRGQTEINLADIIGGGNGFGSGRSKTGINPLNGRLVYNPPAEMQHGPTEYTVCKSHPAIDGTFVPDGGRGPVVVSSKGHVFEDCPDTTGDTWGGIMNGGWQPDPDKEKYRLRLSGVEFGVLNHPAIGMHSNQGITFDLNAIRKQISGFHITQLTSIFGLSECATFQRNYGINTSKISLQDRISNAQVNLLVLVDGKPRFSKYDVTRGDGKVPFFIDIHDKDQFLTLIITEGSDQNIEFDWSLLAYPFLKIQKYGR